MKDQRENIIFLAREKLNPDVQELPVHKKTISVRMTAKTLCFTTLFASTRETPISIVAHKQINPLNKYEKTELQALVFYVARLKGIQEDILRQEVEKKVGAISFDDITAQEFTAARRYLQEKAQ